MENLSVKIEGAKGEIIIREGEALPLLPPNVVNISGDICTVGNFVRGRGDGWSTQAIDKSRAIVITDYKEMTIRLLLDPESAYGATVVGRMENSDILKTFHINETTKFTREDLVKLIKFSRLYFDNPDEHASLLKAYQAFNAQTATELSESKDTRGNKSNAFNKAVKTNLPEDFILNIPIFKGEAKERFRVEICIDVTDASARFWLESVELAELIETRKNEIFTNELKDCLGFVIVNK